MVILEWQIGNKYMEIYDSKLNDNEKRIGELVLKYEKEGLGKLVAFYSCDSDEYPIYYKLVINALGESERVFYSIYIDENNKDFVFPFEEDDLKYYVSFPWIANNIFFENSFDKYLAFYGSSFYDGLDFYVLGQGKTKEDAVCDLIKNLFLIYDIKSDNYKMR